MPGQAYGAGTMSRAVALLCGWGWGLFLVGPRPSSAGARLARRRAGGLDRVSAPRCSEASLLAVGLVDRSTSWLADAVGFAPIAFAVMAALMLALRRAAG